MDTISFDTLQWLNPPPEAEVRDDALRILTRGGTDFWQRTHYGFRRDDGHFLSADSAQDFVADVTVDVAPNAKYDQAGLMVRCSPSCWLKTACEYQPEAPSQLGAVVTNSGYSDWSYRPAMPFPPTVRYRIERQGSDYIVSAQLAEEPMAVHRVARLLEDDGRNPVQVGVYACSPDGQGCQVIFHALSIRARS